MVVDLKLFKKLYKKKYLMQKVVVVITKQFKCRVLEKAESYDIPHFVINDKRYPGQDIDDKISRLF